MKKILIIIILILSASSAKAEVSFSQVEQLIQDRNYQAAEAGLNNIISNHPNSAKAFYAMAQAQAGLGNLEKANRALNQAIGIDPSLKFASSSNIQNLKKAITPQSAMIEPVHESSHFWLFLILTIVGGYIIYWLYNRPSERPNSGNRAQDKPKDNPPSNPGYARSFTSSAPNVNQNTANAVQQPPLQSGYQAQYVPQPQTVVYNNSSNGLVDGMIIGEMLGHNHDTTVIHEKEIIHDRPAPSGSNDNSWEDTSTKSNSWDDALSSSSSWDDSSSSDSSWSDSGGGDSSWD